MLKNRIRHLLARSRSRLTGRRVHDQESITICIANDDFGRMACSYPAGARMSIVYDSFAVARQVTPENVLMYMNNQLIGTDTTLADIPNIHSHCIATVVTTDANRGHENISWQGKTLNAFVDTPVTDFGREQAEWFYEQEQIDRGPRQAALRAALDKLPDDVGTPVVIPFNTGFSSMFLNWVSSCDKSGIDVRCRTIVFPMDNESRDLAEREGFIVSYDETSVLLQAIGTSDTYGDVQFKKHMFFQNAIIEDMLSLDRDFLFQDADMVWLADPFPVLEENSRHDIAFMFDGQTSRHGPYCVNTGFIHFRANEATKEFWNIVYSNYHRVVQFSSQQVPVNKLLGILNKNGIEVSVLPEDAFANGHLFNIDPSKSRLPENPRVVHCSWTLNIEQKVQKFRENGLWFLSNDENEVGLDRAIAE